jgi:hypothetical protein
MSGRRVYGKPNRNTSLPHSYQNTSEYRTIASLPRAPSVPRAYADGTLVWVPLLVHESNILRRS